MSIEIKTFRVNQNNQGFLLGIFKMSELRRFVRFTEHIVLDYDEVTNKPIYNDEVQRKISPTKVDSIADFLIHDTDAFFPTNIVVSIPSIAIDKIDEDGTTTIISLKDVVETENKKEHGDRYLTIIDGQHRVAGIEKAIKRINDDIINLQFQIRSSVDSAKFKNDIAEQYELIRRLENFEIVVTFFIDPIPEYQAMVFSTINRTQTKVSEDLVYSLFGLSTSDSPQKTSLEVILALNASNISPLYNRIKLSGADYKNKTLPPLSQRTAVKSILYQISPNLKQAEIEKNKNRQYLIENNIGGLIFRKYYGNNEDDKIVTIVNEFFKAIRDVYVDETGVSYWHLDSPFNILHTTVGFQALFLILVDLVHIAKEEEKFNYNYYLGKLRLASGLDILDNNNPKRYPLTSKSVNLIYNFIGEKVLGTFFHAKEIND